MKRFILFIFLKTIEICGAIYIPYYVGKFLYQFEFFKLHFFPSSVDNFELWLAGVFFIVSLVAFPLIASYLILVYLNFNWKITHNGKGINWIEKLLFEEE